MRLLGSVRSPGESGGPSGALLPHCTRCLGTQGLWLLAPLQSRLPNHRPSGCHRRVSNHPFLGGQRPAQPGPAQGDEAHPSASGSEQLVSLQTAREATGIRSTDWTRRPRCESQSHHSLASCCPFLGPVSSSIKWGCGQEPPPRATGVEDVGTGLVSPSPRGNGVSSRFHSLCGGLHTAKPSTLMPALA